MTEPTPVYSNPAASARKARDVFLAFVLLVVVYRIGILLTLDIPLFYDEAYYFGWAQELAFGYFSKPPMVAWSIALTTLISDSSWAVRLSSPIFTLSRRFLFGAPVYCGSMRRVRPGLEAYF